MNRHGISRAVGQADHSAEITVHPGLLLMSRHLEETWGIDCYRLAPDPPAGEIEFVHSKLRAKKPVDIATMDQVYEALSATGGFFRIHRE